MQAPAALKSIQGLCDRLKTIIVPYKGKITSEKLRATSDDVRTLCETQLYILSFSTLATMSLSVSYRKANATSSQIGVTEKKAQNGARIDF
jgi:hypothetical protein